MDAQTHLTEIRARLSTSPIVEAITILEEREYRYQGYFRARLALTNKDFLEVAEYFVVEENQVQVRRYRYQWMDEMQQTLRKRWDNTQHFLNLPNFPHHVHIGGEEHVTPGETLGIIELLELLEREVK